jgi:hypothetical protein
MGITEVRPGERLGHRAGRAGTWEERRDTTKFELFDAQQNNSLRAPAAGLRAATGEPPLRPARTALGADASAETDPYLVTWTFTVDESCC